ncbi:ankyrin repeat domain-containing protein [Salmonella enterica]|uniref:Ankyrin repeat domain-containing protein n=6 Tax=Salmonella enterica TaxID=28901 RepID=A0A3U4YH00_SALET|nr:ankyrin repeat domain-containing protein [Salmonella enterica subsp. enterica serovar Heidelberg]EAA3462947.1 ankyrin repeat domain-containing protein [Salmonella enterica subsp. enterica serovar Miami]EAA4490768.1 ankyrin repeat domain-containing protein [Salmonella enterica subsp. enterica]EAM9794999.1 ankyrin repeat domain-containing protein [Salmonella enterica]EBM1014699.1 ankyrin repeat domain-containing protein [Salmonella enterica subsp. enterica serovar Paratyphi B]EBQ5851716.1 ank
MRYEMADTANNIINGLNLNSPVENLIKQLISEGINATVKQSFVRAGSRIYFSGTTALMIASDTGNLELVQSLTEEGACVNLPDSHGELPLMMAADRGHKQIVKFLIESGAYINLKNRGGDTALSIVCHRRKNTRKSIIKNIIDAGGDVNTCNQLGRWVFYILLSHKPLVEEVMLFINEGVDINCVNADGTTALTVSADFNRLDIIKILMESGASVGIETAIDKAVRYGYKETEDYLRSFGHVV